jgi:hypothetical protein
MRKLLINSTALATVAALTASVAVADISITGSTEMKYKSRTSLVTATNGTTTVSDSQINFNFSNKTDNGLTVSYNVVFTSEGEAATTTDESSFSIEGGFGKVVLGENDGAADTFGIAAVDLVAEESLDSVASARINTSSDVTNTNADATKVAYFLPAMGGLTAGVSFANAGALGTTDTTDFGFAYAIPMGDATVTIGGATTTSMVSQAKDTSSNNMGVKFVSGDLAVTLSQGTFDAVDEERKATGVGASYKLANGITLGAYMVNSDDDADASETYDASGIEASYTIAAGLTAVVTMNDYNYVVGTNQDTDMSAVNDKGTSTTLTIKAAF